MRLWYISCHLDEHVKPRKLRKYIVQNAI